MSEIQLGGGWTIEKVREEIVEQIWVDETGDMGGVHCMHCLGYEQGEIDRILILSTQTLRDERDRLRAALQAFCDEVEMDAAVMAYKCDLGAGEWEAFIDRTKLYKQYLAGKAALTPAGGGW